jgi:hypothetical protein
VADLVGYVEIVPVIVPVDASVAANNGDWISLKGYAHATFVVFKGAGASGEPPVLTLQQATDVAGTGVKALAFEKILAKSAADITTVGQFTEVTQTAAGTYTPAAGNVQAMYVIEVEATTLDLANSFDCVRLNVPDVGSTAQLVSAFAILSGPRYGSKPMPSAIAD